MKSTIFGLLVATLFSIPFQVGAHSTFFQADTHSVKPDSTFEVMVYCGTLAESEISIQRDTLQYIYLIGPGGKQSIELETFDPYVTQSVPWRVGQRVLGKLGGFDRRRISTFDLNVGGEGTYTLTTDLYPYHMAKTPISWAEWMEELFMTETQAAEYPDLINKPSMRGRYHKSIKTFLQVGNKRTNTPLETTELITEIIPDTNPSDMESGSDYRFKLLNQGQPVPTQVVTIGQRASILGAENLTILTTDEQGDFTCSINENGKWFMRAAQIRLRPDNDDIDYEVYIATLTFEVE